MRLLNREEERELLLSAQSGNTVARNKLVTANMGLVYSVALKSVRRCKHLELCDLMQEGAIGLMYAITKFDVDRGSRLSTYAINHIREKIGYAIMRKEATVQIPVNVIKDMNRLNKVLEDDKLMSHAALAAATGLREYKVRNTMKAAFKVLSENTEVGDSLTLRDTLSGGNAFTTGYAQLSSEDDSRTLADRVHNLPDKQRFIISHVYGIGKCMRSIKEVAAMLDTSPCYTRQVHNIAIKSLRDAYA